MGRAACDKNGLRKGPWTADEDQKLVDYIQKHGYGNWRTLPKNAGLQRCGKSCRLRWTNYLRPDIKRGRFSFEEEESIILLHSILGNRWSAIAARLPGRTDNEIKNFWNANIRKRLLRMGIDPVTHSPRLDLSSIFANSQFINSSSTSSQVQISKVLGLQPPMANPQLVKLASSLLSSQRQNPSSSLMEHFQGNGFSSNSQIQNSFTNPVIQTTQIRTPIPDCTTMSNTATTTTTTSGTFSNFNLEQYPSTFSNFNSQNFHQLQIDAYVDMQAANFSYDGCDQTLIMHPCVTDNSTLQQNCTPSVMSIPSSSSTPLNSSSNS